MSTKEPRSWFQVVKNGIEMLKNRDQYAYFYGAKGQRLTMENMSNLWNAYPEHFKKYNEQQKNEIFTNSYNKIGYDCSGFVNKISGETGYSIEIYEKRTVETSLVNGVAGQFLFTTWGKGIESGSRHIGIDCGMGFSLQMGWESTNENIAKHKDSVRLAKISEDAWEHSFQTAAVNYNGSYATDPNSGGDKPKGYVATVINCEALNLRSGPSVYSNKVEVNLNDGKGWRHVLFAGEQAHVISSTSGWYQILLTAPGKEWTPWISADYVNVHYS